MEPPANTGNTVSSDLRPLAMLRPAGWLALAGAVFAQPLAAQGMPELDDLIPPSAVEDPEAWAMQGAGPDEGEESDAPDLTAPSVPLPQLTLEPPDELAVPVIVMPEQEPEPIPFVVVDEVIQPMPQATSEMRWGDLVISFPSDEVLFPEREEILERLRGLLSLTDLAEGDNRAALAAQVREAQEVLQRLLQAYGYFDAQVIRSTLPAADLAAESVSGALAQPRLDIVPGRRFAVGAVDLGNLAAAGSDYPALRERFAVFPGDRLSLDAVAEARVSLAEALGESGYAFAVVAEPEVLADHARGEADVHMPVEPGGRYLFGRLTSNREDYLSARHLARIARFAQGDLYRRSQESDLRQAILATGLVSTLDISPVEAIPPQDDMPGTVDLAVAMTPAPPRTLTGSVGYGTEEGFRLAASWEHRNLFPPEGMLRLRGIAGTQEQLGGITFRKNNFRGRDRILTADALVSNVDTVAYAARSVALLGTYEHVSTLTFQKPLSYGGGLEMLVTREIDRRQRIAISARETFLVAALPAWVQLDTSDDLLDPVHGFRLRGSFSPELSRSGSVTSAYVRVQVDTSWYYPAGDGVVLAARGRAGTIVGADLAAIAPSRRFHAGGGGSVRGYGFQAIGPRDVAGQPNGGRSVLELSAEARIDTGLLDDAVALVPFVDAGVVDRDPVPGLRDIRLGAGLGVRYRTTFGPIRVDLGVPLNRQPGDAPVAVYVALGQAF